MVLETINLVAGAILTVSGIAIILFSGTGEGVNTANLIVGSLIVVIGLVVAVSENTKSIADNKVMTKSSNERKTTDGKHVTFEEEVVTRTVKNESRTAT